MVRSEDLLPHTELVDKMARRLSRRAEYDDLYQEGLISVWVQLGNNSEVDPGKVWGSMLDWIKAQRVLR